MIKLDMNTSSQKIYLISYLNIYDKSKFYCKYLFLRQKKIKEKNHDFRFIYTQLTFLILNKIFHY